MSVNLESYELAARIAELMAPGNLLLCNGNNQWSLYFPQPNDLNYSTQLMVYKDIGEEMLQHAFEGEQTRRREKESKIHHRFAKKSLRDRSPCRILWTAGPRFLRAAEFTYILDSTHTFAYRPGRNRVFEFSCYSWHVFVTCGWGSWTEIGENIKHFWGKVGYIKVACFPRGVRRAGRNLRRRRDIEYSKITLGGLGRILEILNEFNERCDVERCLSQRP